jgi:hypothetical protein
MYCLMYSRQSSTHRIRPTTWGEICGAKHLPIVHCFVSRGSTRRVLHVRHVYTALVFVINIPANPTVHKMLYVSNG